MTGTNNICTVWVLQLQELLWIAFICNSFSCISCLDVILSIMIKSPCLCLTGSSWSGRACYQSCDHLVWFGDVFVRLKCWQSQTASVLTGDVWPLTSGSVWVCGEEVKHDEETCLFKAEICLVSEDDTQAHTHTHRHTHTQLAHKHTEKVLCLCHFDLLSFRKRVPTHIRDSDIS